MKLDFSKIDTLVFGKLGPSTAVRVVRETEKAVQVVNVVSSSDGEGYKTWLPKSALSYNADYSYSDKLIAATVAPWFIRKLSSAPARERVALGLSSW